MEPLRSVERFWFDRLQQGHATLEPESLYSEYLRYATEAGDDQLASRTTFNRLVRLLAEAR
jgi:hypothetical protein